MPSIYETAMGTEFQKLHPKIQDRFGFCSADKRAAIGKGIMSRIWHGQSYVLPFLYVGCWRSIMFPEQGRDVPFMIQNYAFVDDFGRETVTWIRTFETSRKRRFDAYMIFSKERGKIVDYLGNHEHLAVDIDLAVEPNGGLRLRSGPQRFYEGAVGFGFPMLFSGIADVCEWYDDEIGKYRIKVDVANKQFGPLFGYEGIFDVDWLHNEEVPEAIMPRRQEKRE